MMFQPRVDPSGTPEMQNLVDRGMQSVFSRWRFVAVALFMMPSFYGGVLWAAWMLLYFLRLIDWNEPSPIAIVIFCCVQLSYGLSIASFYPMYLRWYTGIHSERDPHVPTGGGQSVGLVILSLHFVGFLGLFLFVTVIAGELGGYKGFLQALAFSSWRIREANGRIDPLGVELTYLGWLAIFLTALVASQRRIPVAWKILAVMQFAGNLIFIDRTRPFWILFVSLLLLLPFNKSLSLRKLLMGTFGVVGALVAIFLLVAQWIGKNVNDDRFGTTQLPYWAQGLYYYGTGSFAYFNEIISTQTLSVALPERTFAPFFKILAMVGVGPHPSSEILPFLSVPFPTNVGTFLQVFYQDGGLFYLIIGVFVYSFGSDAVALLLLRTRNAYACVLWANIAFMTAIGFFVPRIGSTGLWLFGLAFAVSVTLGKLRALLRISPD